SFLRVPGKSRLKKGELDGVRGIRKHVKRDLKNNTTVFAGTVQLNRNPSAKHRNIAHRTREQLSQCNPSLELGNVLNASKNHIAPFPIRLKSVAPRCYCIARLCEMVAHEPVWIAHDIP